MDEIQRLLRVTAARNTRDEYGYIKFRALRSLIDRFRVRAMEDHVSINVLLEAFLKGYVNYHPAILAMVDQWIRDEGKASKEKSGPKMSRRDLDDIYAAAADGMRHDEDDEE